MVSKGRSSKLLLISCAAALVFFLVYIFLDNILEMAIRSQLIIQDGTELYKSWIALPLTFHYYFYFFQVLNPEAAMNGAKVKVREIGPFCLA